MAGVRALAIDRPRPSPFAKLLDLHWPLLLAIMAIASIGFLMLYSVAGGNLDPWAMRQMIRFGVGLCILVVFAMIDIKYWMAVAYPFYALTIVLLLVVQFAGRFGKGAERWIDLGIIQIQPSELVKLALVLALARFFHGRSFEDAVKLKSLIVPLGLIGLPVALVLMQPNLGTALILCFIGACILFVSGLRWWVIIAGLIAVGSALPIAWEFLHDYQKQRVYTFLDPESDPLGAGYNIMQSYIAMGSGGLFGKGFLGGTQSQLDFLPEKHTDFILPMLGEEFGFAGCCVLMGLYVLVVLIGLAISLGARSHFARITALGLTMNFLAYILINMAMVMGVIPVVGIPLPLVSYGGTAMLTVMMGFGILMSVHVHRQADLPRNTGWLL
ncbi:Peptidoglycan glycosyltransferase MrdB [Alphaproteobacteria bacterium SO-S41]|nr:Peptidoglycan glycosyltransferase MrdB [Alphaproteobacteria bacterium SO-S41]